MSVDAGTLPPLPTGGRSPRHLGDIDRGLPVCCDADSGAEDSFTIPEGDAEFLGVILGWAHVIDDAYGPDALDEHVVSGDDGSSGYSHHDYCFCLFPVIWLLVEGASLGFVFAVGTICGRDSVPSFVSCGASFRVLYMGHRMLQSPHDYPVVLYLVDFNLIPVCVEPGSHVVMLPVE